MIRAAEGRQQLRGRGGGEDVCVDKAAREDGLAGDPKEKAKQINFAGGGHGQALCFGFLSVAMMKHWPEAT